MPCRDDESDALIRSHEEARQKATVAALTEKTHKLAADLCQARGLLSKLAALPGINIPLELVGPIEQQMKAFRAHREADKRRILDTLNTTRTNLRNIVDQIHSLGGVPGSRLNEELDDISHRIEEVETSDPTCTLLY